MQHHYDSAIFWADKLVSLSDAVEDVFWYAQTMYLTGQYHRAIHLLTSKKLDKTYTACRYLAAKCYYECKEWQEALNVLDLVDMSFSRSTSMINASLNDSLTDADSSFPIQNCEKSMSLLRGKIYEAMDNRSLAADCYKEALRLDVYCFEAFELLVGHHMLTAQEERELMDSLPFTAQCPPGEDQMVKFLYESKLKKYDCPGHVKIPAPLSENLDVIVSSAEQHLYNCDFRAAYNITSKVLSKDPYNSQCLPIHIAVLVELKNSNALFYIAHKLVDYYPDKSLSWFAVGCYYMLTENFIPARWYLSKATTLERAHGPSWLAYGHTFGVNKDHDQAMAAYFTASQIMRGCHLPFLYIGLEYGLTNNPKLAERFFSQALTIAPEDPFVLHEMGVIAFGNKDWEEAERCFCRALERVQSVREEMLPERWEPLLNNLGHVCRKLGKYQEALEYHTQADILCPQTASTYSAIGYVHALMGNHSDAVHYFHKALGLRKDDTFSTTMLSNCLEALMAQVSPCDGDLEEPHFPSVSMKDSASSKESSARVVKLTELFHDSQKEEEEGGRGGGGGVKTELDTTDTDPFAESSLSIEEIEMEDCSS
ncbi:cell division cycle protein 16 homolog isoform X3 [Aplysia californica]|uniref:Cell division cycle protein 16 homolog isoform X3 n=1 Tax=Aplysia californica TaxID=6500 RepID=A0ABM1W2C3_APLCA|nr:cell division cycle protein 16 homolog isoform X3 [Aplysia californica]